MRRRSTPRSRCGRNEPWVEAVNANRMNVMEPSRWRFTHPRASPGAVRRSAQVRLGTLWVVVCLAACAPSGTPGLRLLIEFAAADARDNAEVGGMAAGPVILDVRELTDQLRQATSSSWGAFRAGRSVRSLVVDADSSRAIDCDDTPTPRCGVLDGGVFLSFSDLVMNDRVVSAHIISRVTTFSLGRSWVCERRLSIIVVNDGGRWYPQRHEVFQVC